MNDYDIPAAVEESAKALQSISETSRLFGGYIASILGRTPYTVGEIVNDKLQAYRYNRMIDHYVAAKQRIERTGLQVDNLELPSPAIEIPLLAAASLENRESLQLLWEKLLSAAIAPATRNRVRARHIEILKRLEPLDALLLERVTELVIKGQQEFTQSNKTGPQRLYWSFEEFAERQLDGPDQDEIYTSFQNLIELRLINRLAPPASYPSVTGEARNFLAVVDADLNPR